MKSKIAVIGLGTMGANLARNIAGRNITVSVYNRTSEKTDEFIEEFGNENLIACKTLKELVDSLETPRKIILMISAGNAVDAVIADLQTLLKPKDIIIDGGNSHYKDTEKRQENLAASELSFIGMGISGGEEGALHGPSMMPGGNEEAYKQVEPILALAAADDGQNGKCISYIGPGGSGHFVKMVHNGIEYAIMQLLAESYDILKNIGKFSNQELAETFEEWNKEYNSFLIEITAKIFRKKDPETGQDLIDFIKDSGKQKGTGKWTSEAAFDLGIPSPTIHAAVDARIMSGSLNFRAWGQSKLARVLNKNTAPANLKEILKDSLDLCSFLSYTQGLELINAAAKENNWTINLAEVSRIWRNGCIIKSNYLDTFQKLFSTNMEESTKTSEKIYKKLDNEAQFNWRTLITLAVSNGIPVPATYACLTYYDSMTKDKLPQNLIQAQRDFFGAHTYERTDKEGSFHTDW